MWMKIIMTGNDKTTIGLFGWLVCADLIHDCIIVILNKNKLYNTCA